jgi:hypothetical protein
MKEQVAVEAVGRVVKVLAGSNFRVKLAGRRVVTARSIWRMQKFRIPWSPATECSVVYATRHGSLYRFD